MRVLPLHLELVQYLRERNLEKKFEKQKALIEHNIFYPSLHTELLEPREMHVWSFRIDKKYRVVFIFRDTGSIEIIDINNHYQ